MVPCGSLVHRFAVCPLCFGGGDSIAACQPDSLKEDEEMLHAVLHVDHVQETSRLFCSWTTWFANHIVRERVLLMSLKSYVYIRTCCAHFVNFVYVNTWIARILREHMLLASLHEVFACVSLPFFDKYSSSNHCAICKVSFSVDGRI